MKKFFFIIAIFFIGILVAPVVAFAQEDRYGLGRTAGEAGLTAEGGDVAVLAGRVVGTAWRISLDDRAGAPCQDGLKKPILGCTL